MSTTRNMAMIVLWIIVIFETLFVICVFPPVKEALGSMFAYQIWDLIIKLFASVGTIIAGIAVYWKFHKEKNRQMYENRLKEVYAPLIKLLKIQETYRCLYMPHITSEKAPIIYTIKTTITTTYNENGCTDNVIREKGFLDRDEFIKVLKEANYGLARPHLLYLIAQYELVVFTENNFKNVYRTEIELGKLSEELEKYSKSIATNRLKVEFALVKEIVDGYNETINKLGLDIEKGIDLNSINEELNSLDI